MEIPQKNFKKELLYKYLMKKPKEIICLPAHRNQNVNGNKREQDTKRNLVSI